MVEMVPCKSSNIEAVGHNPTRLELFVQFTNGELWKYRGVPSTVFGQLLVAESKGGFFAKNIKSVYAESEKMDATPGNMGTTYLTAVHCPGCRHLLKFLPGSLPAAGVLQCQTPGCRNHARKFEVPVVRVELKEAS